MRFSSTKIQTILAVAAGAVLLSSCTPSTSSGASPTGSGSRDDVEQPGVFEDGSTMKAIQDRGKLVVGIRLDVPPFAYRDRTTGTLSGFDIEIARLIAKGIFGAQIEGKVEFIELDPRDRELALQQNKVDIAMGRYAITVPAKRFVDFAGPYYVAHQDVLVNRDVASDEDVDSLPQLNGRTLCTVLGSTNYEAVQRTLPQADVSMEMASVAECVAQVTSGTADALVADKVDLLPTVRQGGNSFEELNLEEFAPEPYGIGVNKQRIDFRQFLNDRLELIVEDDRWEDAYDATIGSDGRDEPPPVTRY